MTKVRSAGRWITRRSFLYRAAAAGGSLLAAPALRRAQAQTARPAITHGVQSGDVLSDHAIIWSRCDRLAQMLVEWSLEESFARSVRVPGPDALANTDFTARLDLAELPPGQQIFYRVMFEDLANPGSLSEAAGGRLRTAPVAARNIRFVFSGDEAGQGWGINQAWGGYKLYETMRAQNPDFFIHQGDQIYADNPLKEEVTLEDGTIWRNVVTPAKAKVAETLDEFRGNFAYNLLDACKRRFAAEVPFLVQWDDHETHNNWYPGEILGDERYNHQRLAARRRGAPGDVRVQLLSP